MEVLICPVYPFFYSDADFSFFPETMNSQSVIKSVRACINRLWSDRNRYRSSALVADLMGNMGRSDKPPRIRWSARFYRSTRRHSVGPEKI